MKLFLKRHFFFFIPNPPLDVFVLKLTMAQKKVTEKKYTYYAHIKCFQKGSGSFLKLNLDVSRQTLCCSSMKQLPTFGGSLDVGLKLAAFIILADFL